LDIFKHPSGYRLHSSPGWLTPSTYNPGRTLPMSMSVRENHDVVLHLRHASGTQEFTSSLVQAAPHRNFPPCSQSAKSRTRCWLYPEFSKVGCLVSYGSAHEKLNGRVGPKTAISAVCGKGRLRTHNHPPTAKSRNRSSGQPHLRSTLLAALLYGALVKSWKHGLQALRWSNQGTACASGNLWEAMPLRVTSRGTQRALVGNSRDKPRASISKMRFSSSTE